MTSEMLTPTPDTLSWVTAFFDAETSTFSYLVKDPHSNRCAIIDSVLDFDYAAGQVSFQGADRLIREVRERQLQVDWILETHVHADHLSAAPYLKAALGGQVAIGEHICTVQHTFGEMLDLDDTFARDGSQFDRLLAEGDVLSIGSLPVKVLHTPGHTPACVTYVVGDEASGLAAFVGDTLFMPDTGTARADFPGGNAGVLYDSIQKILALPATTRLYLCHDYPPDERPVACMQTVAVQKRHNVHWVAAADRAAFIALRQARDHTLAMPRLIWPSLQVNMRAGHFPAPNNQGQRFLKVPVSGL